MLLNCVPYVRDPRSLPHHAPPPSVSSFLSKLPQQLTSTSPNISPTSQFSPESDLNMAPVTEIAYITLKPGVQLTGSSAEAKAWAEALSTIQAQEGYQRLHWGTTLENEELLMLLIGTFLLPFPFSLPLSSPSPSIPTLQLITTC